MFTNSNETVEKILTTDLNLLVTGASSSLRRLNLVEVKLSSGSSGNVGD